MASTVTKLPKPKMRNLLTSRLPLELAIGTAVSISFGLAWKFGVQLPRKAKYAEFYKTYDAEADFQRMKKAGVFQCVDAEGNINTDF
uniref:Uncharacterized protein n=1 Tax=Octopus bimaculoides TaxID=37653 RepID=A0A0L8IBK3_OCTBM